MSDVEQGLPLMLACRTGQFHKPFGLGIRSQGGLCNHIIQRFRKLTCIQPYAIMPCLDYTLMHEQASRLGDLTGASGGGDI
jgi:hypothetical protein